MKLSIIVPIYNVEKYVRACIESIYKQGLDEKKFEVIIVNDGTTGNSMEVISDIIDQHSNIVVINQENQGLSVARNNGIAIAKGEYILMTDSDDLLIENTLSSLLEIALETKADLVVADFISLNNKEIDIFKGLNKNILEIREKDGEKLFLEDLNPRECYVWRTLFRREFISEEKIHFIPKLHYEDIPFTHECYIKAKKCIRTPWIFYIYRKGREGAITSSFNTKKAKDYCKIIATTWNLSYIQGITPRIKRKIQDDTFIALTTLVYFISHDIKESSNRFMIINYLKQIVPNLVFKHGIKQIIITILYQTTPNMLIRFRRFYGLFYEDDIFPFYRHKIINLLKFRKRWRTCIV